GSIVEYNEEVLNFFKNQIEKFEKIKEEYEINKEELEKIEPVVASDLKSADLERCLDYIERTALARKQKLDNGENVADLKIEEVNTKKIEKNDKEINELKNRIKEINKEFALKRENNKKNRKKIIK